MSAFIRRHRVVVAASAAALVVGSGAAQAAELDDYAITGVQYVNKDCARNEYAVDVRIKGTTDDQAGYDFVRVEVWDDGELKDSQTLQVEVGSTLKTTAHLSFVGTYGDGAPGVGIYIRDVNADGDDEGLLAEDDPFYPEDVDGVCSFDVERIGGENRIETAALLSKEKFVSANAVLIATANDFPDALSGAPLAAQEGAPLLLTSPSALPSQTRDELLRLEPATVFVIGGPNAVSASVQTSIQSALPAAKVVRVAGKDRYETASKIAGRITQDSTKEAFLASGENYPDALVLSAMAARHWGPVLLTHATTLPTPTAQALAGTDYDALYVAGGDQVVSDAVAEQAAEIKSATLTRYAGSDRYDTAAKVLATFPVEGRVLVATGEKFPDALAAVPVAARNGAGVALTRPSDLPSPVKSQIVRLIGDEQYPILTVVGGTSAVSMEVQQELAALVNARDLPAVAPTPAAGSLTSNGPAR